MNRSFGASFTTTPEQLKEIQKKAGTTTTKSSIDALTKAEHVGFNKINDFNGFEPTHKLDKALAIADKINERFGKQYSTNIYLSEYRSFK